MGRLIVPDVSYHASWLEGSAEFDGGRRPSARRRGHAAKALDDALPLARDLGINLALITCDEDNAGSRAIIEKNGGVYEDTRNGKRRYWVETGQHAS